MAHVNLYKLFKFEARFILRIGTALLLIVLVKFPFLSDKDGDSHAIASVDQLVISFERVVLDNDFIKEDNFKINKWMGPIKVFFYGYFPKWHRDILNTQIKELTLLTGIQFRETTTTFDEGEYYLYFVDGKKGMYKVAAQYGISHKEMRPIVENSGCMGFLDYVQENKIERDVAIYTQREETDYARRCLIEELVQGMGLPADGAIYRPSVFSNVSEALGLSINDKILIRTLYDGRIKPGMTKEQAMPLARKIITELVAKVKNKGEPALYQR